MRITCTICGDIFSANAVISAVTCGHTFHSHCLLQWLENSRSCPQCRQKTTEKSVLRLFLDIPNEDLSQHDPDMLQNTVDNLKFQIVEKDQLLIGLKEENSTLKDQAKGLREECLKLEKQHKEKDIKLSAYAEQNKHLNKLVQQVSKAEDEAEKAKSKLKLYQHIDAILQEHCEDIDETIASNLSASNLQESVKSLATVTSFLKRHITKLKDEKKCHVEDIRNLQNKLRETKTSLFVLEKELQELKSKTSYLQEDNEALERENASLTKKVAALQEAIISPSADVKNSLLRRFITESPAPAKLKRKITESQNTEIDLTPEIIKTVSKTSQSDITLDVSSGISSSKDGNSPYLQVKESSIDPSVYRRPLVPTLNRTYTANKSNIFKCNKNSLSNKYGTSMTAQVSHFPDEDVGYDGLGGHHKVDYFPRPNNSKLYPSKKKKPKQIHVVTNKGAAGQGTISHAVIKDFFKNTFDD